MSKPPISSHASWTIRNIDTFVHTLWDWACLDGCFGQTRIKPTDVDGLIERRGKFLLIEAKSPGVTIPTGQSIMFDSLLKTGVFTIIVVWGQSNNPERLQIWGNRPITANLEIFREKVTQWYKTTNG